MKKIVFILLAFLMVILAANCYGEENVPGDEASYAELVFDTTRVHTIEVIISDADREDQLANPKDKTRIITG